MSEFNPLVERVDALLKRHQQQAAGIAPAAGAQDYAVPVLDTGKEPKNAPTPPPDAPAAPPPVGGDEDIPVLTEIVDPASMPAADQDLGHAALGAQIEAAVLEKLLAELDRALDQRLGRTIADLLEQVLHGLRAELSVSVRQMVREAVATSVAREIAERARHP